MARNRSREVLANSADGDSPIEEVRALVGQAESIYYRLGRLLSEIRWDRRERNLPFDPRYVEKALRLKYRKAMYLISIHDKFDRAGINERRLKGLAWSKAKEIARLPAQQLRANFGALAEYARNNTREELVAHINDAFDVRRRMA